MPLYSAERPVVERSGTLIMVDDDRMPLAPGSSRAQKSASARSAAIRLTGAIERRRHLPAIIREMLLTTTSRAAGAGHRPRRRRLDGAQRSTEGYF